MKVIGITAHAIHDYISEWLYCCYCRYISLMRSLLRISDSLWANSLKFGMSVMADISDKCGLIWWQEASLSLFLVNLCSHPEGKSYQRPATQSLLSLSLSLESRCNRPLICIPKLDEEVQYSLLVEENISLRFMLSL